MDEKTIKTMGVTISVGGRWHAFDLAKQLLQRGALRRLITSYPYSKVSEWGVPRAKAKSLVLKEVLERAWRSLPLTVQRLGNPQFFLHELFDKQASAHIPKDAGIFVGWSSFSLHSMRRAKANGAKTILERGSSHIVCQNEILRQEYEKWGASGELPHPRIIEKELREYALADYIAVPSSFVEKTFLDKGIPMAKLLQIPYGVDLSQFRQVSKQDDIFRIIFAGSLSLRKGVPYLLQAFTELNLKNSELVFCGGVADEIRPFLEKYHDGRIIIRKVPHNELYRHYSQGSVFILPSIEEGLARVLFEAMACGLPVIATPNTGAEDIVENDKQGFIVPIRDTEALKEKILYLYENRDVAREMGQRAKQKVSLGFTWDDYGDRIMAAYESILKP